MGSTRVLIADDEPLVRRALRRFVASRQDLTLVGEATDGREAVELAERTQPALVLLDVQMPVLDGLAVAHRLRTSVRPEIVFITAFDQYAVPAFEVQAADYVVKPFDDDRLGRAVDFALERLRGRRTDAGHDSPLAGSQAAYLTRFLVRTGGRLRAVEVADIEWFKSADNYVIAHTSQGRWVIRGTLRRLESALDPVDFVRVHRTAMVRVGAVMELRRARSGTYHLMLRSGTRVPVSRAFRTVARRLGHLG